MRSLYSKFRVLTTRMAYDGLEYFALVERPNDGGDHVHQLKLLPFHIVGKQPLCIRRMFEEPAVKYPTESSMGEAQRIDDVLTRSTCSGVTLKTQPKQADHNKCPHTWAFAATLSP